MLDSVFNKANNIYRLRLMESIMMSKLFKKSIIITTLTMAISACGGGGESATETNTGSTGSAGPTLSLSFNLSQSSLTIDENAQKEVSVTVNYTGTGVGTLSYSYDVTTSNSDDYSNISISGDKITVAANEVEQNVTYSVEVTLSDGTLSDTKSFTVSVLNKPQDSNIAEAQLWTDGNNLFSMNELDPMLEVYVKAAYFNGGILESEIEIFEQEYADLKSQILKNTGSALLSGLLTTINDYSSGTTSASGLLAKVNEVKALAKTSSNKLIAKINELSSRSGGSLPELSPNKLMYVQEYGVFSSVIGNESMGSFDNDVWSFTGKFEFMNTLVSELGNTTECSAS